ncbi:6-deoxyerythronolide-B synthase EryA1, modules 1 and 2 [Streptomyces antimycoticus]
MVDADLDGRLRRVGLTPMPAADAVEALTHALHTAGDAVLADVSWQRFLPVFTASRPAPFFTALAPAAPRAAGPVAPEGTLAQRLAGLDGAARHTELLRTVREHIAAVAGHVDPAGIDPERPLQELGFDSLMSVELRNRLSTAAGTRLPADPGLRPPHGHLPRHPSGARVHGPRRARHHSGQSRRGLLRRADRHRRHGLPLPR